MSVSKDVNSEVVSVSEWLLTSLIMLIPIVNFVMMFVWAFGGGTKKSKANFFKATLILTAISIVFGVLAFSSMINFFMEMTQ